MAIDDDDLDAFMDSLGDDEPADHIKAAVVRLASGEGSPLDAYTCAFYYVCQMHDNQLDATRQRAAMCEAMKGMSDAATFATSAMQVMAAQIVELQGKVRELER